MLWKQNTAGKTTEFFNVVRTFKKLNLNRDQSEKVSEKLRKTPLPKKKAVKKILI